METTEAEARTIDGKQQEGAELFHRFTCMCEEHEYKEQPGTWSELLVSRTLVPLRSPSFRLRSQQVVKDRVPSRLTIRLRSRGMLVLESQLVKSGHSPLAKRTGRDQDEGLFLSRPYKVVSHLISLRQLLKGPHLFCPASPGRACSSAAISAATRGAIATAARALRKSARVRRARKSSTVRAISKRAAQRTSAPQ